MSGREGAPTPPSVAQKSPQHKATCDSPCLLAAPPSCEFWRGQHIDTHRICQAISCKCPQLEEHFRGGRGPRGSELLIGRRQPSAVKSSVR